MTGVKLKNGVCPTHRAEEQARYNGRNNAISKIAYGIAGTSTKFYRLPKDDRKVIRDTATRLYEYGADASFAASKEVTTRDGFVYAITNRAWPWAVKIGRAFDPDARLAGFQTSSPYRDYALQYAVYFEDCYEAERTLHRRLNADRMEGEWFHYPVEDAIAAIDQLREEMK